MIKKTQNDDTLLLSYIKQGEGKLGIVKSIFNIDKNYNALLRINLSSETKLLSCSTKKVQLNKEEKELVNKFITKNIIPISKKTYFDDEEKKYETEHILYKNLLIEDEKLNNIFKEIVKLLESNHQELDSTVIYKNYDNMCSKLYKRYKG